MCECVCVCKMCYPLDVNTLFNNGEHPHEDFPQVLQAVIRLELKALADIGSIQDTVQQVEEMGSILEKLTVTHIDSDNYANYLFQRAEQLSSHLETYQKIVCKVDIGSEIEIAFRQVSEQFVNYLQEKLLFKTVWIESLELIEVGKRTAEEKLLALTQLQSIAGDAYNGKHYFDLADIKTRCDEELNTINELMESCLNSGKRCKELGSKLYDQLTDLEVCFQEVVRRSMRRINQMKRIPAVQCEQP